MRILIMILALPLWWKATQIGAKMIAHNYGLVGTLAALAVIVGLSVLMDRSEAGSPPSRR